MSGEKKKKKKKLLASTIWSLEIAIQKSVISATHFLSALTIRTLFFGFLCVLCVGPSPALAVHSLFGLDGLLHPTLSLELGNKVLKPPSQSLSSFPCLLHSSSLWIFSIQWIQRRQRTLRYTVLCLPKSLVSKRSADFVAALSSSPLQPLSCKWSWMLFSKECILKRNSHFCLCVLSQTLFSPISSPLSRSLLPQPQTA